MGGLRHLDTREVEASGSDHLACHLAENPIRLPVRRPFVAIRGSVTAVRLVQALCRERSPGSSLKAVEVSGPLLFLLLRKLSRRMVSCFNTRHSLVVRVLQIAPPDFALDFLLVAAPGQHVEGWFEVCLLPVIRRLQNWRSRRGCREMKTFGWRVVCEYRWPFLQLCRCGSQQAVLQIPLLHSVRRSRLGDRLILRGWPRR